MKNISMNVKQAALLACAVTGKSILPSEFEGALIQQIDKFSDFPSLSNDLKIELKTLRVEQEYSPVAIRLAHAGAIPERASFLLEGGLKQELPPVLVSHYKKGGTGKTTILANIAIAMAGQGIRVLYIDADPQGTSTTLFGQDIENPMLRTLQHVIFGHDSNAGRPIPLADAIIPLYANAVLDLIPSDIQLSAFERLAYPVNNRERLFERMMARNIPLLSRYDIILIDTNPGTNLLNFNLMFPATHIMMPVSLDVPSMKSMHLMISESLEMSDAGAKEKDMIMIGNVHQESTTHSRESLIALREAYEEQMMQTVIPAYAGVSRQGWEHERGRTLIEREPTAAASKRLSLLSQEILERVLWRPMGLGVLEFDRSESGGGSSAPVAAKPDSVNAVNAVNAASAVGSVGANSDESLVADDAAIVKGCAAFPLAA